MYICVCVGGTAQGGLPGIKWPGGQQWRDQVKWGPPSLPTPAPRAAATDPREGPPSTGVQKGVPGSKLPAVLHEQSIRVSAGSDASTPLETWEAPSEGVQGGRALSHLRPHLRHTGNSQRNVFQPENQPRTESKQNQKHKQGTLGQQAVRRL